MKIDSHQHFWKYDATDYPWIGSEHLAIKRDFFPEDLEPILRENQIDEYLAVQARQSLEETDWLLELAERTKSHLGSKRSTNLPTKVATVHSSRHKPPRPA